jgi:hypothetical protein
MYPGSRALWHEEARAVARLRWGRRDDTAARDALLRWQRCPILDVVDQELERPLGMGLDVLELQREGALEVIDVVPVLDLLEAVLRVPLVSVAS